MPPRPRCEVLLRSLILGSRQGDMVSLNSFALPSSLPSCCPPAGLSSGLLCPAGDCPRGGGVARAMAQETGGPVLTQPAAWLWAGFSSFSGPVFPYLLKGSLGYALCSGVSLYRLWKLLRPLGSSWGTPALSTTA